MPAYRLTDRSGAPLKIERQPHDEGNDKEDNRQRAFRHALSCHGYAVWGREGANRGEVQKA